MERRRWGARPPYKAIGLVSLMVMALIGLGVYVQFRGDLTPKTKLTVVASRAGLVMAPGSKVTYNGVEIGRVASISEIQPDGNPAAKFVLEVDPKYLGLIPGNVVVNIKAATVFGGKYVSFTSPQSAPLPPITPSQVIDATSTTTETNTLFETLTAIMEKVDPVKLNLTLSAAAEALSRLGDKIGAALIDGNVLLDDVNPRLPKIRADNQRLAELGDIYANAAPDLWDALSHAVTTARTINQQQRNLDDALLAAVGFGNVGGEAFGRGGPYLARGAADLVTSSQLLDEYSPEIFCTIRNFNEVAPKLHNALGDNGYALGAHASGAIAGAPNPYIYPENLPRTSAKGGPGGKPGCWQAITRELWPAPLLVADIGMSLAPYNHFEPGSPVAVEYVWGRQLGDNTINP
ncbi:MCE family protein [Mycobacterium haemophilum]